MVNEQIFMKWTVGSGWLGAWLLYGPEVWGDPPFMLPKFKIMYLVLQVKFMRISYITFTDLKKTRHSLLTMQ
jgi:hypothetical protein